MRRRRKTPGWPQPRQGHLSLDCPAPSVLPGHPFHLTLTGAWEEIPAPRPHHSPADAAAHHALVIARNITATLTPADTVLAAARINTVLGRPTDLPHLPIRVIWAHATLTADEEALAATLRHQRHRHETEQRQAEQSRLLAEARNLRTTLMSDPSLALAYWFAAAPHAIDENTVPRLELLHRSLAAYAPQGRWAQLARTLHTFAETLPDDAKNDLIETAAVLADRHGQHTTAEAIRNLQSTNPAETVQHRP
ncbi:hypothetical protein [Streptomyces hydrogenans]|uniref:hypothetical protein n=1 Tax=Streptomyces hydrogenans TaxID=1873719 RepID=UPI0036B3C040